MLDSHHHFVRAFDKFRGNDVRFNRSDRIELYHGEFLNEADLREALEGIDYVFHFISTTTPISSLENPLVEIDTNIRCSVELFQLCVEANVKKVIFASSGGAIYGNIDTDLISEDTIPNPISPYAVGKLSIEKFLDYFREKSGLESVSYRISNPYGARQSLNSKQGVIPIFLNHVASGEPITIYGDGSMVRDYLYVKDAAQLIVSSFEETRFNVYNVGSGTGVSLNELLETINSITGKIAKVHYVSAPSTFVERNVLDTSRFVSEFGITSDTSLAQGIELTWEHILHNRIEK